MILSMPGLSNIRVKSGLTRRNIESITTAAGRPITIDRQRELETGPIRAEPWFDEAADLSRILLLPGILPLLDEQGSASGNLTLYDLGTPFPDEVDLFKRGVRLPLSMACRLAVKFGLDDPIHLERHPLHVQIWSTLEQGERLGGPPICPWCLGEGGHLPTCLPDNLWSPLSTEPYATATAPRPLRPGTKGTGRLAFGLKRHRKATGITQDKLAGDVGMHPNYLARIEQLRNNLTEAHAITIARILGCTVEDLFGAPAED